MNHKHFLSIVTYKEKSALETYKKNSEHYKIEAIILFESYAKGTENEMHIVNYVIYYMHFYFPKLENYVNTWYNNIT